MSTSFPLFPPNASSVATEVDLLYLFIAAVSAFFVVVVAALVVIFAIKFRRRHPAEVGADIHGSLALELTWTFIPFVISMVMFFWGADLFYRLARPPADSMEVFVVGRQWMWKCGTLWPAPAPLACSRLMPAGFNSFACALATRCAVFATAARTSGGMVSTVGQ